MESVDEVVDSIIADVSEEKPKRRSWKGFTPEKAKEYYEEHYSGMTRTEVQKTDPGFYKMVRGKSWLDEVFPESLNSMDHEWLNFSVEEAKQYCEDNFAGISRSKIRDISGAFYDFVRKKGWSDEVLPKSKHRVNKNLKKRKPRSWKGYTPEKAKEYYAEHYAGMNRTEVQKNDPGFYKIVCDNSWLDDVFPESLNSIDHEWLNFSVEEAKQYCEDNFTGMIRAKIRKVSGAFYYFIKKKGWLDDVLPEVSKRDWSDAGLDELLEFYEDNYPGKSRSDVKLLDSGFHSVVNNKGLLDKVFPKSKSAENRDWSWMDTPEKAKEHYEAHFPGMNRKEVGDADSSFYALVLKKGWCDEVFPESKRRDWSWMDTPEKAKQFYEDNFSGLTRSKVEKLDCMFYNIVKRNGWREQVFPPTKYGPRKTSYAELRVIKDLLEDGLGDPSETRRPYFSPEMIQQPEMRL